MIPDRFQGRARSKGYVPAKRRWTEAQRLDELERIVERAERGTSSPTDEIAAAAHIAALRAAVPVSVTADQEAHDGA